MRKIVLFLSFIFFFLNPVFAGFEIRIDAPAVLNGRLFVLGVGINDNGIQMHPMMNCENDTRMVAEHIISLYQSHPKCDEEFNRFESTIISKILLGTDATPENIKAAYESIALQAKPNDYFFFIFNGMSEILPYVNEQDESQETHLFFYGSTVSLSTMARWLELIPCNKQMIITEAGYGKEFGFELIAALSPKEYAYIVDNPRNRIIVTTNGVGLDNFECGGSYVGHGPLNWFLLNSKNIFNTFYKGERETCLDTGNYRYTICDSCFLEYDLAKLEIECNLLSKFGLNELYSKIMYEQEFLFILSNYLKKSQSRGVQTLTFGNEPTIKESEPENHALVIGINEYEGKDSWNNLRNPLNDAQVVAEILDSRYGYSTSFLENATKNEILDELLRLKGIMGEKDNFLFFIAGHGYYDAEYSDGYIVARDTKSLKEDKHKSSYIDFASLQKLVGNMSANNIFLIFDVCFGGTFGSTNEDLSYTAYDEDLSDISIGTLATRKTEHGYKSRMYLASGEEEVPDYWNNSSGHSPFADKLIKILSSDAPYLTPGYIQKKLELNITETVLKEFWDHDAKGDFFLIPSSK